MQARTIAWAVILLTTLYTIDVLAFALKDGELHGSSTFILALLATQIGAAAIVWRHLRRGNGRAPA